MNIGVIACLLLAVIFGLLALLFAMLGEKAEILILLPRIDKKYTIQNNYAMIL